LEIIIHAECTVLHNSNYMEIRIVLGDKIIE